MSERHGMVETDRVSALALRSYSVVGIVAVIGERVGVDVDQEGRRAVCGSEIGIGNNMK